MEQNQTCSRKCKKKSFEKDNGTGAVFCSTCRIVQSYDYVADPVGVNGAGYTFVPFDDDFDNYSTYNEKMIAGAKRQIDDFAPWLDLSGSEADEVKEMIDWITHSRFGEGDQFRILIGACCYAARKDTSVPLSVAEVADTVPCDHPMLEKMIDRVVDLLNFKDSFIFDLDIVS